MSLPFLYAVLIALIVLVIVLLNVVELTARRLLYLGFLSVICAAGFIIFTVLSRWA